MIKLRFKLFFDYSHLERTYYKDVEWPQAPRVAEHVVVTVVSDEEGGGGAIGEVDSVLWHEDGSADVYIDVPNERDICFQAQEQGWLMQDPDSRMAT